MCEDVRLALSARLDGYAGEGGIQVDEHLAACADCRAWLSAVERLRFPVPEAPDLTERILNAVAADRFSPSTDRRRIVQVALVLLATVQAALAVPILLDGLHLGREAASFDIALAVGFALAAWRPERARAFVPVAFVLAGCLILTSVFDIIRGAAVPAHEISHVAALAEAGLLLALSRLNPRPRVVNVKTVLS